MVEEQKIKTANEGEDIGIRNFLEGFNPKKYVVAVQTSYQNNRVDMVVDDPVTGRRIDRATFEPFTFIRDFKKFGIEFYGGDRMAQKRAMDKYKIHIEKLRTTDDNGMVVDRLDYGYKFKVSTKSDMGMMALQNFFREGGVEMNSKATVEATFNLIEPEEDKQQLGLYTFIENKKGVSLLYNNKEKHFELHTDSTFVSKYKDRDDDENATFISVKGGAKDLIYQKEFSLYSYKERKRYVVTLHPVKADEEEEEEDVLVHSLLDSFFPEDYCVKDADELKAYQAEENKIIRDLRKKKLWSDEHAIELKEVRKARVKALNPKNKKIVGYPYKKVSVKFRKTFSDLFFTVKPEEQFMIQKGIRLFKGFEKYSEVHKFIFDIETTGLDPRYSRVFMIGLKDNRKYSDGHVMAVAKEDDDQAEVDMIMRFFKALFIIKPSVIYGYNSENFDWEFLLKRLEILGVNWQEELYKIDKSYTLKRKPGQTLKVGGDVETYTQTSLWGATILDILHSVRRTQAINSDLKEGGLKYVCKFEKIAKANRVYISNGGEIYKIYKENKTYAVHKDTNVYEVCPDQSNTVSFKPYGEDTIYKDGHWIVNQYLTDDLWETEQVDERYNEDRFMVGKYLPTYFVRTCTMGGASQWNLIMTAWSYENKLAVPHRLEPHSFTGGLSRTFMLGKFWNIYKFDFSGLYPSLQLEFDIFPKLDVTGASKRLLKYFKDTRDVFKKMANDDSLPEDIRKMAKAKQLPLKILNNSNFGANGSQFYNWADFFCAERITCMGRLYLRNMIAFFMKRNCVPTVCDTDGINMAVPEMVTVDIEGNPLEQEMPISIYEFTDSRGKLHVGANALVAKYNDEVLNSPYMKLDNDGMWPSAINVSRKNYANMEAPDKDGKIKVKIVGNTLKDKTMPEYVKEFIDKGVRLMLDNKGKEFVDYYYAYLEKICMQEIPLKKIANKARIRETVAEYDNRGTDKNGRMKGKKAYMELIKQDNLKVDKGEVVYYVNDGIKKSHSFSTVDKVSGKLRAYLVTREELENDPEKKGSYNVAKYVDVFNKRVKAIITPFKEEVRNNLLTDDFTKREIFTEKSCELISYQNPNPKDNIDTFFKMEPSEVKFWNKSGLNPRLVLENFEADDYEGDEYIAILNKVTDRLRDKGITVKSFNDVYDNNDIVLSLERHYRVMNKETGEEIEFPDKFMEFIDSDVLSYPPDPHDYEEFITTLNYFGEDSKLHMNKEYYLNMVEEGVLRKVKAVA